MHRLLNTKASVLLLAFFISFCSITNCFSKPLLALIIDDIGDNYELDQQAINLSGQFTYALLPFSRHAQKLSELGIKHNREFILHSPMQSVDSRIHHEHTLHMHMTERQFIKTLAQQIEQFPFIRGMNNHMGSLLTRHAGYMDLLMKQLKRQHNFYFVDSRTTDKTVALQLALENNIPAIKRDIFLDSDQSQASINKQLNAAVHLAKKNGYAVVIAHPYSETLSVLKQRLTTLQKQVKLVSVSTLISTLREPANEKSTRTLSAGL